MYNLLNYPLLVFVLSFFALWLSAVIGAYLFKRRKLEKDAREDLGVILAATLTLLGLIIGFSFSMAMNRYDMRKNYEAEEANAIGTEYVRADLLPAADAAKVRALLVKYLDQRVLFYTTRDKQQLAQINADTARLQAELWSAVKAPAVAQPSPSSLWPCGHERCAELAGIHAGSLVEPNPNSGMGPDGGDRHLLQPVTRLRRARHQGGTNPITYPAACRVHRSSFS